MKISTFLILLCITNLMYVLPLRALRAQNAFNSADFYSVMASKSLSRVDSQLNILKAAAPKGKEAYEGALLMKRAGLVSNPKNKLNLFKSGRRKLDDAVAQDSLNAEFRFIRLMIQENTPKILRYNKELEADSRIVGRLYKNLAPPVQKVVKEYSRTSDVLKPELF
ncbi:MAG TPA: hypothetical protein VEZ17_05950 [Chitinophagaceae bacterium]|nr:hypothetical protein [Chitinophagaceae bacterium]